MCGIAGIFDRAHAPDPERGDILTRMTRTLTHRGPDDEGYYLDGPAGLGHRRLSIIDLAGGHQPVSNEDGTVWVVFNGEIYNYPDLTRELEGKGHRFQSRCDTECIVHGYEEWGQECVERFRGMFAFALWDRRRQRLFLARDRLGKKPLYYAQIGATLIFGSEIKALLEYPGLDRTIDLEALSDYVSLLYVPSPKSIFRTVRKLPPGYVLVADRDGVQERRYWDVSFAAGRAVPARPAEGLAEVLRESVHMRLRSDVPLGAFLSGGLDSSAVVGFMASALESPAVTSSIGFPEDAFNELQFARQVAEHFHTEHHEHVVTPDAVDVLQKLVWHYDEPFADSSAVPTYYVSKLARSRVTVALSGDGGDENFAGYRRYHFDVRENQIRSLVPAALRRPLFRTLGALYPKADYLPQLFRAKTFLTNLARTPWEAYLHSVSGVNEADKAGILAGDVKADLRGYSTASLFESLYHAADGPDSLSRIQYIDFKTYLPDGILAKVDRASMAVSLEVRCPILDHRVVEYAAALPSALKLRGTQGKLVFKDAIRGLVPDAILSRGKMGFVLPIGGWLRRELAPLVEDYVLGSARRHRLFEPAMLQKLWREHRSGLKDRTRELWSILVFNLWHDRFARKV
ncbi:asparagine synthase (glutamine-hydrolyzing) [Candidatus Binatia bacterium]|nr:asparagine synthase (glutamine-hydrolyzing) [Candidatus Binatia bacterium]